MRNRIYILLLVLIAALLWFSSFIPRPAPILSGTNIIAFGDSLVLGVGATFQSDFVFLVSQTIDEPIVNKSVAGDTTGSALKRLAKDVLENDPKIVIVLLGGNDYIQNIPMEETFDNLSIIIKRIEETGAVVLLLGVRGGAVKDTYKKGFKKLASRYDLYFVPNVLDGIIGNPELLFDAIHPNNQGYRIISEKVSPVLLEILGR